MGLEIGEYTPFTSFPKISRLFRPIIITEKIDGSNAAVVVSDFVPLAYKDKEVIGPGVVIDLGQEGWKPVYVYAQSRKQVISPEKDNFGFATWVRDHACELAVGLGVGVHFGEFWGAGIQRRYDLDEKRFSLFNVSRWGDKENERNADRPACCHVVPVLAEHDDFNTYDVRRAVDDLVRHGSYAAPGFMDPEGIVCYHRHSNTLFKTTIKNDDKGKEHGA